MEQGTARWAEMQQILEEYKSSGLTRRQFCQKHALALTTFDYWQRAHRMKAEKERPPRLMKVKLAADEPAGQFIVSLANGRRIESSWRYADAELVRLIRIVESA